MQVINSEISGKTCTLCNDGSTPNKLLKYYAGVGTSQYTGTPVVTLVTNQGVRVEVDDSKVDIVYPQKYNWKFSPLNQDSNVGISSTKTHLTPDGYAPYEKPISSVAYGYIKNMVSEAEKLTGFGTMTTVPEWKTLTKEYYTNGHGGETFKRYNSYNGMLSKNGVNTPRPHVTS
tara:strand:- start:668 stop:1189 length:522 start_codon:yes stop_codon:yes gene_type:complete